MFRIKINHTLLFIAIIGAIFASCQKKSVDEKEKAPVNDSLAATHVDTAISVNLNNPNAGEKVELHFQPEVGKTYIITNNASYTAFQQMDTATMNAVSSKYIKMQLKVLSNDAGNYKVEFTITDSRKTVKDDSSTISYKYNVPMSDPKADLDRRIEDCMVNAPLIVSLNSKGEGTDMQGYDAIIKKVKDLVKAETGSDVPDNYIAQELGTPTDNLENFFISYPDTAVKIGDTWKYTTNSVLQGMPIILTNNYVLADRKDGICYVNFNTLVEIDKSQLPKEALDQLKSMKFHAWIKGTGEIDEKTGWPMLMKISQGMELSDTFQGKVTATKQTNSGILRSVVQ